MLRAMTIGYPGPVGSPGAHAAGHARSHPDRPSRLGQSTSRSCL